MTNQSLEDAVAQEETNERNDIMVVIEGSKATADLTTSKLVAETESDRMKEQTCREAGLVFVVAVYDKLVCLAEEGVCSPYSCMEEWPLDLLEFVIGEWESVGALGWAEDELSWVVDLEGKKRWMKDAVGEK